ncbi:MAG: ComF family protein [Anaerolineae bacterium]|nr:ComF family protein [Anaerolineae bacterium]
MTDDGELREATITQSSQSASYWGKQIRLFAHQWLDTALDVIFPPRCIGCKRVGSLLCSDCQARFTAPPPLHESDSPLSECRATAEYGGIIRDAIHAFKFDNQFRFAPVLADRLFTEWQRAGWPIALVTAAPLHINRLKARGYNQAGLLAARFATLAQVPFQEAAIRRVRETHTQVGLNRAERQLNVTNAFEANSTIVNGKNIVIIDDVYTTGATLKACADALLKAGAASVWGLTVAKTHHDNQP